MADAIATVLALEFAAVTKASSVPGRGLVLSFLRTWYLADEKTGVKASLLLIELCSPEIIANASGFG